LKGVYTLLMYLAEDEEITVGSLGEFAFRSGFYSYTGSAMGSGAQSLGGRVSRHLLGSKRMKWHIDWFLADTETRIVAVFTKKSETRLECKVNQTIKRLCQATIPVMHFGSTDCRLGCGSHLLYFGYKAPIHEIKEIYRKI